MRLKTDQVILAALLVLLVGAGVLLHRPEGHQPRDHSIRRTNREGYRALFELAELLGFRVGELRRPWTELPADAGMLWVIDPTNPPLQDEAKALLEWVRAGHVLVLAPRAATEEQRTGVRFGEEYTRDLFRLLDLSLTHTGPKVSKTRLIANTPLGAEVGQVRILGQTRVSEGGAAFRVLVRDESGAAVVVLEKGAGRVYVLSDPGMLSNAGLQCDDNAVLGSNLLALGASHGRIYFDEYHHGFRGRQSRWAALVATPGGRALWPLLVAAAALLCSAAQRFGAPVSAGAAPRRSAMEHVQAFAHVYRSAGAGQEALELVLEGFRRRLAQRLGAEGGRSLEELAALAESRGAWAAGLGQVVAGARAAVAGAGLEERELVHWCRRLGQYEQEGR